MESASGAFNLLIVGVGGQGVITLSDLVVRAALRAGYDVKQSEIHGMSQRGGSVSSHVRVGPKIHSPVIDEGTADVLLALEKLEALRHVHYLAPGGLLIVDDRRIAPMPVSTGAMEYPADIVQRCRERAGRLELYCGEELVAKIGSARMINTCFAGVLSKHLPFTGEVWRDAVAERFAERQPEANLRAFEIGRTTEPND